MNTSFERSKQTTDEWYTPKWIVDALGSFDLVHALLKTVCGTPPKDI